VRKKKNRLHPFDHRGPNVSAYYLLTLSSSGGRKKRGRRKEGEEGRRGEESQIRQGMPATVYTAAASPCLRQGKKKKGKKKKEEGKRAFARNPETPAIPSLGGEEKKGKKEKKERGRKKGKKRVVNTSRLLDDALITS